MKLSNPFRHKLLLVILSTLLIAGCTGAKDRRNEGESDSSSAEQTTLESDVSTRVDTEPESAKTGLIESVKDTIAKNQVVKCSYLTDGQLFYMYIKGNKAALEAEGNLGDRIVNYQGVIVDEKYYIWDKASTEGLLLDLKTNRDEPLEVNDHPVFSLADIINELEANKQTCTLANPPDSIFQVPSGLKFSEM